MTKPRLDKTATKGADDKSAPIVPEYNVAADLICSAYSSFRKGDLETATALMHSAFGSEDIGDLIVAMEETIEASTSAEIASDDESEEDDDAEIDEADEPTGDSVDDEDVDDDSDESDDSDSKDTDDSDDVIDTDESDEGDDGEDEDTDEDDDSEYASTRAKRVIANLQSITGKEIADEQVSRLNSRYQESRRRAKSRSAASGKPEKAEDTADESGSNDRQVRAVSNLLSLNGEPGQLRIARAIREG